MSADTARCPHCQAVVNVQPVPDACPACGRPLALRPRSRRLFWPLVTAVGALVILGLVVGLAYTLERVRPRLRSGPPSEGKPATPEPSQPGGPVASLLSIERPAPGSGASAVVSLRRPGYHDDTPNGVDESILGHEIIRQAVLVAVRDTGAVVHDALVGDNVPAPEAPSDLEVGTFFPGGRAPLLIVARRSAKGREELATFELGGPRKSFIDYVTLIERAESLSRAPDGIPKVLEQVGLKRAAVVPAASGPPAEDVETRLARLTFTEQFAAVRLLHEEIRSRGESPERLGALVRGYANLSVLTEFHWGSKHKALKARALLTAQRLVARDPRSPTALWHRAYARALIGFHKDALDDLAAAAALAKAQPDAAEAPRWVPLIDGLCRFETRGLLAARDGPDGQLALFLAFLSFEESVGAVPRVVSLGQEVLAANPECYRVHAKLGKTGGIGSWHVTTLAGAEAMDRYLPDRLGKVPGLPEAVGKRLADRAAEPEVVKALLASGPDPGEPSWPALGRMVADARFAFVAIRVDFMRTAWNVPVDDYLDEVWPLVADHPYHTFLEALRRDPAGELGKHIALLKDVEIPDIGFNEFAFSYAVATGDMARNRHLNELINCHGDMIYRDLTAIFRNVGRPMYPQVAHDLLERSPYAPQARMWLAEYDWAFAEPHAREWEDSAGAQPDVLFGLGAQYTHLKRWDDAVRCFTNVAEMSPDVSAYQALANVYKAKGDEANWEKTLEKARTVGDVGLGGMQIDADQADYYMRKKEWQKALPYARAAAATWASRGLLCAAHCYEGVGDWAQAELWQRRNTERYPDNAYMGWFIFCKRTGHGDLAAARTFALDHINAFGDHPAAPVAFPTGVFRLLDGSPREALALFRKSFTDDHTPCVGFIAAVLSDDLGDAAGRDRLLAEVTGLTADREKQIDSIVKVVREGLASKDGRIDKKALVTAVNEAAPRPRLVATIFAARLLHAHGDTAKADDILGQMIAYGGDDAWAQALATIWRREWAGQTSKAAPGPAK